MEQLRSHALSSFPKCLRKDAPGCLKCEDWLGQCGGLKRTRAGLNRYVKLLALAEERLPLRRKELARELCRGWYVGTREGKKQLLDELPKKKGAPANRSASLLHDPEEALQFLERSLQEAGRDASDLELSRKGADWKVDLARPLKANFAVSNAWLSEHLKMGHPCAVSRLVSGKRSK